MLLQDHGRLLGDAEQDDLVLEALVVKQTLKVIPDETNDVGIRSANG